MKPSSQNLSNTDATDSDVSSGDTADSDDSNVDDKDEIRSYALSEPVTQRRCLWLPPSVRTIIVGKSGCGKTTLLSHLLLCPDVMDYNKLTVCGRSLHQPEYRIMRRGFDMGLSNTQIGALFRMKDKMKERCGSIDKFLDRYTCLLYTSPSPRDS